MRGSQHFAEHPVRHREGFEDHCIPLKIHGDGTPVTGMGKSWAKMVGIFSVSSLLICGPHWVRFTRCSSGLLKLVGWARNQSLIGMARKCFTLVLVKICVVDSSFASGP